MTYTRFYYGGMFLEGEARAPILNDRLGLSAGFGYSKMMQADGAKSESWGISLRSIIKIGQFELSPFYGGGKFMRNDAKPVAVVTDGYRPKIPDTGRYLGQDWVRGAKDHGNFGATLKGAISDHLPFPAEILKANIVEGFRAYKPKLAEINARAFDTGREAGHARTLS